MWSSAIKAAALLGLTLGVGVDARQRGGLQAHKPAAHRARQALADELAARDHLNTLLGRWDNSTSSGNSTSSYRYRSNQTEQFFVSGLPEVDFDLGEFYSGLIPIDYSNTSEALFFIFQPTTGAPVDEVTIWLNGGPGCSSLEGFFQENGRFIWPPGTYKPYENPYAWTNLTNMLWVEQPIGTGFSIGTPKATTEEEIAQDFIKFFKNFEQAFGISNYKIYVTGESYAGRYVPYISAAMLDANDTQYYNLSGALVYDPCIGEFDTVQEEIPTYPFIEANQQLFNFNESFMATLKGIHEDCGYADFIDTYFNKYPPTKNMPTTFFNFSNDQASPISGNSGSSNVTCDILDLVIEAVSAINPCFDIYEVNTACPLLWDVLGFPGDLFYIPPGAEVYFNRTDVKSALHAPDYVSWSECAGPVFVGGDSGPQMEGDTSLDPIQKVLPQVIDATQRVLVGNGDYDMVIITAGTLASIQNMTWGGKLGFQAEPTQPITIGIPDLLYTQAFIDSGYAGFDGPQGVMGVQHYERGLMWAETFQSGHMQPMYQPASSYRHLQWLLGHVDEL